MRALIRSMIRHRRGVLVISFLLTVLSALAMGRVGVNYNMREYLPGDAPSTVAANELEAAFAMTIPNVRLSAPVPDIASALALKSEIAALEGVSNVLWLDDAADVTVPLDLIDPETVESYYRDGRALYQIAAASDEAAAVTVRLRGLGPDIHIAGALVDLASAQNSVTSEMITITIIIVPLVLLILLLTTHSWFEPLVFMAAIGVGILLNMGTNIFLGEVSFITQAIAAVLQLAVSMDYAIFLLNRFNMERRDGHDPTEAMARAIRRALTSVASSALTTVLGFLALIFMRFRIGGDLGIVMAKGIVFSFLSVMVFMPALLLLVYPLVDRTTHRSLLPDFRFMGRFALQARIPILLLVTALAVPAFLASRANTFFYGTGFYPEGSIEGHDREAIEAAFGQQVQMALMVPRGDVPAELRLQEDLEAIPGVTSVISYVSMVDPGIPPDLLDPGQISQLLSDEHALFIVMAEAGSEGEVAFGIARQTRETAARHYGDSYQLAGENVTMLDMKHTVEADEIIVNGLAILAIALTILFAYRSLSLPLILVLVIEVAIWINLSVPYFTGNILSYIGYLIISTVQLGATVDYAILYTQHYLDNRRQLGVREAVVQAAREAIPSLLPPAAILTCTGLVLGEISSLAIVAELGVILGRGAALSFLLVVLLLPGLLSLLDPILPYTTLGLKFLDRGRHLRRRPLGSESNEGVTP